MPVPYVYPNAVVRALGAMCRSVPLLTGQSTLIQLPPFKWVKFRTDTMWVRLRSGALAHVRANDFIGRAAYFFGDHDPKITRALAAVLTRDMTLLDIGANVGTVTLSVAARVKRAIAIEPQPRCAALLRESIAANGFQNVEVHELALAEADGELPMYGDPDNIGTFSLNNYGNRPSRLTARTVQASAFLEGLKIEGDYVVKIDVEGYEENVIQAADSYFRRHRPRAILFEHTHGDLRDHRVYQLVVGLGFRVHAIRKSLFSLKLGDVGALATDFIALPPGQRLGH